MTNEELLAKIKAEIDKRYAEYSEKKKTDDFTYYEGMADALDLFEQFIDTLESEKPMKEGLEEEIDRFEDWMETYNQADYPTSFTTRDIARHFAQWGAERFAKIVRGNLPEIGNNAQSQFERLYFEITGTKMYGGYND